MRMQIDTTQKWILLDSTNGVEPPAWHTALPVIGWRDTDGRIDPVVYDPDAGEICPIHLDTGARDWIAPATDEMWHALVWRGQQAPPAAPSVPAQRVGGRAS